jgi:hypothetical protein
MNPMVDEDLRLLMHSASLVLQDTDPEFDWEFSRIEFLRRATKKRPPVEWTQALRKAYSQVHDWLDTGDYRTRYIARHTETILHLRSLFKGGDESEFKRHEAEVAEQFEAIGQQVTDALLKGETETLKALWDLSKRWAGETREKNPKPIQLSVIQEAFTLWRTLKRNPTRAELWTACEAAGIGVGDTTNKRGILKKTGLQFLAKE